MRRAPGILALLVLVIAPTASAQGRDWYARFSLGSVSLNGTSDVVGATGSALVVEPSSPGLRFDVGRALALDLALEGSLAFGRADLAAAGGDNDGVSAGQMWATCATLLFVWRPPLFGAVRPFVAGGIGLTALPYYIRDAGARSLGIRELKTGVGVGPAAVVGLDYQTQPDWLVTFDVRWLDTPVDLDVVDDAGAEVDKVELPFAPVSVNLGIGWRF